LSTQTTLLKKEGRRGGLPVFLFRLFFPFLFFVVFRRISIVVINHVNSPHRGGLVVGVRQFPAFPLPDIIYGEICGVVVEGVLGLEYS
jgi:hypothetical protein